MSDRSNIVYYYDGSFDGLLTCIFKCFEQHIVPISIKSQEQEQGSLWNECIIETDTDKAKRVNNSIKNKISIDAQIMVRNAYLTCLLDKELHILRFLMLGYKVGSKVMNLLTDDRVDVLLKAVNHLSRESHLLCGFIRFSIYGDYMASIIEPKNYVLPIIAEHFCDRYRNENFLIYDKTHKVGLLYENSKADIIQIDSLELPPPDLDEDEYRRLWKQFYKTIAIKGRYNPRCRMSHMPKRFWGDMIELT